MWGLVVTGACLVLALQAGAQVPSPDNVTPDTAAWYTLMQTVTAFKRDYYPTGKLPVPFLAGKSLEPVAQQISRFSISKQIVGGSESVRGASPWTAYVYTDANYMMTGSLIHGQWVLTDARMVSGAINMTVILGMTANVSWVENGRTVLQSTIKFVHPNYTSSNLKNQIALVKLPILVPTPTEFINMVRLPRNSQAHISFAGLPAVIAGFGLTSTGSLATSLRQMNTKVMNNTDCVTIWGSYWVTAYHMCAEQNATNAMCAGDNGGPLVYKESDDKWTQIGMMVYPKSNCGTSPAVFTRLSMYLGWISEVTNMVIRA